MLCFHIMSCSRVGIAGVYNPSDRDDVTRNDNPGTSIYNLSTTSPRHNVAQHNQATFILDLECYLSAEAFRVRECKR